MTKEELTERFIFLDVLRKGGQVNMFGAAKNLQDAFGDDSKEAKKVLCLWMETFSDKDPEDRAEDSLE